MSNEVLKEVVRLRDENYLLNRNYLSAANDCLFYTRQIVDLKNEIRLLKSRHRLADILNNKDNKDVINAPVRNVKNAILELGIYE